MSQLGTNILSNCMFVSADCETEADSEKEAAMDEPGKKEPKAIEIDDARFTTDILYRSEVLLSGLKHACHSRSIILAVCKRLADEGLMALGVMDSETEETGQAEGEEEESLIPSDECNDMDDEILDVQSPSDLAEAADLLQACLFLSHQT